MSETEGRTTATGLGWIEPQPHESGHHVTDVPDAPTSLGWFERAGHVSRETTLNGELTPTLAVLATDVSRETEQGGPHASSPSDAAAAPDQRASAEDSTSDSTGVERSAGSGEPIQSIDSAVPGQADDLRHSSEQAEPSEPVEPTAVSRETSVSFDELADTPIAQAARRAVAVMDVSEEGAFPRPSITRVMTVANQKGGVGKTTSAVNLAVALAMHGARVLVIDLDPQGNASTGLGVDHHSGTPSIYDVLIGGSRISDVTAKVEVPGVPDGRLRCVPATIDLAGAEVELVQMESREYRLREAIREYLATYAKLPENQNEPAEIGRLDYVLIDCPPSLGLLTVNALVAAREVLIPIQCEYYALEGLGQLLRNVDLVRTHLNSQLYLSTILLTMYDARTKLAEQVADEVRSHFGDTVLSTVIPRSVRVSEAPSYRQSVMTYDPGSRGAITYYEAAREMAERGAPADGGTQ